MTKDGAVVYLVDDDPRVREALTELLESLGMVVLSFDSAATYLTHPRNDQAACLIIDLNMPGINGLELQDRLKTTEGPPIIFISGRGDIRSSVHAIKAGAIEFFTKPLNSDILIPAIKAAFEQDRLMRKERADIAAIRRRYDLLSPREREVLPLVVTGLLNKQAAAVLGITEVTLQIHRSQIMRKMEADSFADLVRMASKLGIPKEQK